MESLRQNAESNDANAAEVPMATPVLSYGNLKVIAVVNPPAIGGLVSAVFALPLIALGAQSIVLEDLEDWGLVSSLGLFAMGLLGLGGLGLWLSRDPNLVVSGRRLAGITILFGLATMVTAGLTAADNVMYGEVPEVPSLSIIRPPPTENRCTHNLQRLSLALQAYAASHGGRLPNSLNQLRGEGNVPLILTCPGSQQPYLFAAPDAVLSELPPDTVVVFEPLTGHGLKNQSIGRLVVRANGHVIFEFGDEQLKTLFELERQLTPLQSDTEVDLFPAPPRRR